MEPGQAVSCLSIIVQNRCGTLRVQAAAGGIASTVRHMAMSHRIIRRVIVATLVGRFGQSTMSSISP
jgi:hypothetical protein